MEIKENTYPKAFFSAALLAGITTGLVLEYRNVDPLNTYFGDRDRPKHASQTFLNLLQTSVVAFLATLLTLWLLKSLFGMGQAMLSQC